MLQQRFADYFSCKEASPISQKKWSNISQQKLQNKNYESKNKISFQKCIHHTRNVHFSPIKGAKKFVAKDLNAKYGFNVYDFLQYLYFFCSKTLRQNMNTKKTEFVISCSTCIILMTSPLDDIRKTSFELIFSNLNTGFPRYSRELRSWEIWIHEYQNRYFSLNLYKKKRNTLRVFPCFFPVFPCFFPVFWPANDRNREY